MTGVSRWMKRIVPWLVAPIVCGCGSPQSAQTSAANSSAPMTIGTTAATSFPDCSAAGALIAKNGDYSAGPLVATFSDRAWLESHAVPKEDKYFLCTFSLVGPASSQCSETVYQPPCLREFVVTPNGNVLGEYIGPGILG
jgi:hypothetical protein